MCRGDPFEYEPRWINLLTDRQRYQQHAITVGNVGTWRIDRDCQHEFPVIIARTPYVEQKVLDLFELAAQVPVKNQATISCDFDHNVLRFNSRHRGYHHQAFICAVDL